VTLTATVTTNGPNTPTGTVTFTDGATPLGTGTLNGSAQATINTSNLTSPGQHSITAVYNGDATNNVSPTSPALMVTVNAATFTLTANAPTSQTISSGQSAPYTLTVTPNGSYTSQISFACSIAPATSGTCAFVPPTITPNSSATSTTLTISGAQAAVPNFPGNIWGTPRMVPMKVFWLIMEIGGLFLLWGCNQSRLKPLAQFSLAAALLVTTLSLAGCSGSGSSASNSSPSQTYQITITASAPASPSGNSASQTQTQIVSLTVH
jgi:hypothetical protein